MKTIASIVAAVAVGTITMVAITIIDFLNLMEDLDDDPWAG